MLLNFGNLHLCDEMSSPLRVEFINHDSIVVHCLKIVYILMGA